jgi:putative oxidoreductase
MNRANLEALAPRALGLLRIVTALLFLEHGLMKLISFPAPLPGVPHPMPLILQLAMWMEVIGSPLLLLGLFTRPVALLLSGEMAFAYWMFHVPHGGLYPAVNMGEPAVLYCFVFFYFFFAGPGAYSADALLGNAPASGAKASA